MCTHRSICTIISAVLMNSLWEVTVPKSERQQGSGIDTIKYHTGPRIPNGNVTKYEGCSNMNASSFITFFTYMLQQNGKRFYKGLYVTFKLAPDLKKTSVYLSSYSALREGHVSILTNSMLRTYTSDIDERIILR